MYNFKELFRVFIETIKDSATSISKTFTGSDSATALVMIIFYLLAFILLILLIKGLIKALKSLINLCFPSKKKNNTAAPDKDSDLTQNISNNSFAVAAIPFHAFDGEKHLNLLTQQFDTIKSRVADLEVPEELPPFSPSLLVFDGSTAQPVLDEIGRSEILLKVAGGELLDLQKLLQTTTKQLTTVDNQLLALNNSLAVNCKTREKLINEETSVFNKHNSLVGEFKEIQSRLIDNQTSLIVDYSELFDLISQIEANKQKLLLEIEKLNEDIAATPYKLDDFVTACDNNIKSVLAEASEKTTLINSLKNTFASLHTTRIKQDDEVVRLQGEIDALLKSKVLYEETIATLKPKLDELLRAEAEKKAQAEAERLEKERLAREEVERKAREEAERLEQERKAKEEAKRLEKERIAKEKAERLAKIEAEKKAKEEAKRLEKERLEKEKAERLEQERLKKERLAQEAAERKAQEEAARLEQERKEKEETERLEKEAQERRAKAEAERLERERVAKKQAELAEKFKAEKQAREEAERLEQERLEKERESQKQVINSDNTDGDQTTALADTFKEKVQAQAQNLYALSFDDVSPEIYERIAKGSKNRKITVMKPAQPVETSEEDSNPIASSPADASSDEAGETSVIETAPDNKIDHMAELKKQWAEEKAHKEQFAAEQARKKAEEERRKKELLEGGFASGEENN